MQEKLAYSEVDKGTIWDTAAVSGDRTECCPFPGGDYSGELWPHPFTTLGISTT